MKLIKMTDFVINIEKFIPQDIEQYFGTWQNEKLIIIDNYAHLLKRPLELGIFIPCDEDGNFLEEPNEKYDFDTSDYGFLSEQYNKSKERVLFECAYSLVEIENIVYIFDTIEDIPNLDLTLTESAQKQLGL